MDLSRSYFLWCYVLGVAFVVAMFGVDASFGSFCWTFSCCFVQIFSLVCCFDPILFLFFPLGFPEGGALLAKQEA